MYEYLNKIVSLQRFELSHRIQNIELFIYSLSCFFIPFLIGHPQFLVGSVVNAFLVLSSLNLQRHRLLPIIVLPSLGVLARGLIFGPFTVFLIYFIPFIWVGNAVIVFGFKYLYLHKKLNYLLTLIISASLKASFLFLVALILYKLHFVPAIFLTAMGITQLETALLGGFVAFVANRIRFIQAQPLSF